MASLDTWRLYGTVQWGPARQWGFWPWGSVPGAWLDEASRKEREQEKARDGKIDIDCKARMPDVGDEIPLEIGDEEISSSGNPFWWMWSLSLFSPWMTHLFETLQSLCGIIYPLICVVKLFHNISRMSRYHHVATQATQPNYFISSYWHFPTHFRPARWRRSRNKMQVKTKLRGSDWGWAG